jgi:hypothetical protein
MFIIEYNMDSFFKILKKENNSNNIPIFNM